MTQESGQQREKKDVPATYVPDVRSKALYTLENAPLQIKSVSQSTGMNWVKMGALSLLLNKLVTFQTIISGHFLLCLPFLPNNLFDFTCDVL